MYTYKLFTYYGSPVGAEYNDTFAINMFISNWKKHKCQGMSKHLKDHKNTLDPRGLIGSQCSVDRTGLIWSCFLVLVRTLAAAFWTSCNLFIKRAGVTFTVCLRLSSQHYTSQYPPSSSPSPVHHHLFIIVVITTFTCFTHHHHSHQLSLSLSLCI